MGWKIGVALGALALFAVACGSKESAPGPATAAAVLGIPAFTREQRDEAEKMLRSRFEGQDFGFICG